MTAIATATSSASSRALGLVRYRSKRARRSFVQQVKYPVRKVTAARQRRVGGRFSSVAPSADALPSPSTTSLETCSYSAVAPGCPMHPETLDEWAHMLSDYTRGDLDVWTLFIDWAEVPWAGRGL